MRSLGILALVACAALALPACGEEGGGEDEPAVAMLLAQNAPDREEFENEVDELCDDCGFIYEEAGSDPGAQAEQAEQALGEGADVLVLDPVNGATGAAVVTAAHQRDVPVISYNALAPGADYYVGYDDAAAAELAAQALVDKLDDDDRAGRIVMLNGPATDENARVFKLAAHSVFDPSGHDIILEYDTPGWSAANAKAQMAHAIDKLGPDGFAGVYAANDAIAGGVIEALEEAGIDPATIPVTGQDATPEGRERVDDGKQFITVRRPFDVLADLAAEYAVDVVEGDEPGERQRRIAPQLLTDDDL